VTSALLLRAFRPALLALALLPAACATPPSPPPNPFAGIWSTPERQQIAFRDDTIVVALPNEPPAAMAPDTCDGAFRFGYGRRSRDALIGLAPKQPDLRQRLGRLLGQSEYPVAEVSCGEGATTYVMLDDRDLVAIHRDRDVAGLERLSRL